MLSLFLPEREEPEERCLFWFDLKPCGSQPWLVSTHRYCQTLLTQIAAAHPFRLHPVAAGHGLGDTNRNKCPFQTCTHPRSSGGWMLDFSWRVRDDFTGFEFPYSVPCIAGSCFPWMSKPGTKPCLTCDMWHSE